MISIILPVIARYLRTELNLGPEVVGIRSSHKPPPTAGDNYLAIYGTEAGIFDPDIEVGLDLKYSIGLTATRRTGYNPYDIVDEEVYARDIQAMEYLLYRSIGLLHKNYSLLSSLNAKVQELNASAMPYIEPFRFANIDPAPTLVNEQWFRPEASLNAAVSASQTYPYCGMIMEASLTDCRRTLKNSDLITEIALL